MEPEPSTWRVHPVRLFSEPMEKCVELKVSLLACPSMRSLHAEYFQPQKKKLRPYSLFALTEEDQREDLEIFVVNNQERETSVKVLRSE